MKKNFVKICAVLLGFALVACLDDDKYALDPSGTKNVIEFLDPAVPDNPSGAIYPVWTTTTELAPSYTFQQTISYSGPNDNNKNIDLVVEVDPGALAAYNEQMDEELGGDTYELMPASYYTFPTTALTMKKGQTKVQFDITVKPDLFDLTRTFALPLRITSASEGILSEHFSAGIFVVVVKNMYDGVYLVNELTLNRYSTATPPVLENPSSLGGVYPPDKLEFTLSTLNDVASAFTIKWKDNSAVGGVGGLKLTVDPDGAAPAGAPATADPVTVSNTETAGLGNSAGLLNYFNWDGATNESKTFVLNFEWVGSSGKREVRGLTMTWDHARP